MLLIILHQKQDTQGQIKSFLKTNKHIDGIISADNVSGTVIISVANSLGYKIPNQLSVVGFADEQISNLSVPKLAIINQNAEKIGESAFNLMLNRLSNKSYSIPFVTEEVATTFSIQESF